MANPGLITRAKNTWCPGCGNFAIQHALKNVLMALHSGGIPLEQCVLVTGIGCHAKLADYLGINSFYAIHGRTLPVATGILLANPDLTVIASAGDGDMYAEGLDHLIFAAKRNLNLAVLVHNNRVYGLTTGQYTPTSPLGFHGRSTPAGTIEYPFNPLELVLAAGGTFIARGYTRRMPELEGIITDAIRHQGFGFIDVLQICATYNNMTEYYTPRVYPLPDGNRADRDRATSLIREWDYNRDARIGLGVFYQAEKGRFDQGITRPRVTQEERNRVIGEILKEKT